MSKSRDELLKVAKQFAADRGIQISRFLGDGNDGAVWESSSPSAIKVLQRRDSYLRERDCYFRLRENDVTELSRFAVPVLIDSDDTLQVIEMTVVFPPCIIDFAKSYTDHPPDFSDEVMRDWIETAAEKFEDNWPIVEDLLAQLKCMGIHYYDASPYNVRFPEPAS